MKKAELALYVGKADGAATYRFFEPEMEAGAHRRRALEVGLRSALDNGEIQVMYQPLVDLRSGIVAGCEALVRWKSAEWGLISPAEFIPVAEATGLIDPIGEWVLREAVKTARLWPEDTVVAVNLSPVQFKNQRLLATVVAALAESGLPPQRLELEVTESLFIDGSDHAYEMLRNLRSLGFRTSLDDFGTGYSSLSYLQRFPFDKIKIDKSFIDDVAVREESLAIIRAIVALADALGMSTTAEGVETLDQVAKLREAGCTQIQGYVFSRPRPSAEIAALFGRRLEGDENDRAAAHIEKVRAGAR
jgi:EAL domain-containing protein (putative c-di-GMP-specific phosphodiesterase class I)